MHKGLKIVALILITIILLILIASFSITTLVNTTQVKNEISLQVYKITGQQLAINGDISWSFFPWLGVKINSIELSNPTGFPDKPFVKADKVNIRLKVMPLLYGKIEATHLTLEAPQLTLLVSKDGQKNWQNLGGGLKGRFSNSKPISYKPEISYLSAPIKNKIITLNFAEINIKDGQLNYINQQNNTFVTFSKIEAQLPLHLTPHQLQISPLQGEISNSKFNGTIVLSRDKAYSSSFDLTIDSINLDRYLQAKTTQSAPEQAQVVTMPAPVTISSNLSSTRSKKLSLWTNLDLNGHLTIKQLNIKNIQLTNLSLPVKAKNGLINLNPVSSNLYQGTYQANIAINLIPSVPRFDIEEHIQNMQLQPFLEDFAQTNHFKGVLSMSQTVTTHGNQLGDLIRNLAGKAEIAIQNASLQGFNLSDQLRQIVAIVSHTPIPSTVDSQATLINTLTAHFVIKQGIADTQDLIIDSPIANITGYGFIDLLGQNWSLILVAKPTVLLKSLNSSQNLLGDGIPLLAKGTFSSFVILPDMQLISQNLLAKQSPEIQAKAAKFLQKHFGIVLQQTTQNNTKTSIGYSN